MAGAQVLRLGILIQKNEGAETGIGIVTGGIVVGGGVSITEILIIGQLGLSFIDACKNDFNNI